MERVEGNEQWARKGRNCPLTRNLNFILEDADSPLESAKRESMTREVVRALAVRRRMKEDIHDAFEVESVR